MESLSRESSTLAKIQKDVQEAEKIFVRNEQAPSGAGVGTVPVNLEIHPVMPLQGDGGALVGTVPVDAEIEPAVMLQDAGVPTDQKSTIPKDLPGGEVTLDLMARSDLAIISSNGVIGPSPCAKTCAGATGRTYTVWYGYGAPYFYVYTNIDISACGFADIPIITTSVEGTDWHMVTSGSSSVVRATKDGFSIYLWGWTGYYR